LPKEIYRALYREVAKGDRHSAKVADVRKGIMRGALAKRAQGIITDGAVEKINTIVTYAETRDFKPLLYVIPAHLIESVLIDVPIADRAHPLAPEFRVEALPRACFDVIDL
jgi:hypothetical protein